MKRKILIVGGVAGGASCAVRARRLDEFADIKIFEQGPFLSFANCGLPYHIGQIIPDEDNLIVATPEMFENWFNIDVRPNSKVISIDKTKQIIKIKNLITKKIYFENYDSLVLSTGGVPNLPKIKGIKSPGIFTLKNIPDAIAIKSWIKRNNASKAIILGGGLIGLEIAENLSVLGIEVNIIEKDHQILPNIDRDMASFVQKHIKNSGIKLSLNKEINKLETDNINSNIVAFLNNGERIQTDIVIIATGIIPLNELAIEAKIEIGEKGGIKVNSFMQTSDPNIWAIGDVIEINNFITNNPEQIPLAGPANRQGRIAAESIINQKNKPRGFRGSQGTSVCGVMGMTVASTGLSEKEIKKNNSKYTFKNYGKIHVHAYDHAEYYPGAKKITLKLLFSKNEGLILGAQAIGIQGVEKRIDVISLAIQNKSTVYNLSEAELCYAPQYGSAKDIVNIAGMAVSNILDKYFEVIHWDDPIPENCIILDVREDFIYKQNHIDRAINIPLEKLRKHKHKLDYKKEILVYCSEGKRSYYACRILNQMGFNTKSFSGGYSLYKVYQEYYGTSYNYNSL